RRFLSMGARRRGSDLGGFLRVEPGLLGGRVGRHVHRHHHYHDHVSRPHLLDRRDEPGTPAYRRAYSFARTAFGPCGGFVTGLTENIDYVVTPAVIVYFRHLPHGDF